jgi:cell wall-associated NlpC family hydrolase
VQRALYVALADLGKEATNAKNGEYGQKTIDDVKAYQRAAGLDITGRCGQNTFQALWERHKKNANAGAFDDYGVSLAFRVNVGNATTLADPVKQGNHGKNVTALQRMLWRALGAQSTNARNGEYGQKTADDLRRFLNRADWAGKPTDKVNNEVWRAAWAFGDEHAHDLAKEAEKKQNEKPPADQIRQKVRTWGEWYVQNKSKITYAQIRPYPKNANLPMRTDCSGSSTHVLYMAGCPNDPHGRGWDGQGYTGTCQGRGQKISFGSVKPGDCVFYGNQGDGVSSHMVIVIGPGDRALNFGSDPPRYVNISSYWLDARRGDIGARRYF